MIKKVGFFLIATLLIGESIILSSCNQVNRQENQVQQTESESQQQGEMLNLTSVYCAIPGMSQLDIRDSFEQIQTNSNLNVINQENGEYQWQEISIGNAVGSSIIQFNDLGYIESIKYTFANSIENKMELIKNLVNQYGTATMLEDNENSALVWLLRQSDGTDFQMKLVPENEVINLYIISDISEEETIWNYQIPDMYNTGSNSSQEELVDLSEKYPECVLSDGRIVITEKVAKQYNYCFEGFKLENNISFLNLENSVVIKNFYIKGSVVNDYKNNAENVIVTFQNGEIDSGLLRACNVVLDKVYMHDSPSDFINALYNVTIRDCYFRDGGTDMEAHADGIQVAGYDNLDAYDISLENVRIDMPYLPGEHVSNACVMIQPDYGAVKGISLNHCYLNGGGFTIYSFPKKNTIENVFFKDTILGAGSRFGIYYKDSQDNMAEENTTFADRPYIGSIVKNESSVGYYLNNYSEESETITGEIRMIEQGNIQETFTFENKIDGYIPFTEYENEEQFPEQPENCFYEIEISDNSADLIQIVFYNENKFVGGYYILAN